MSESRSRPICAKEALDLLNCVAEENYDLEKCTKLLASLRNCVLNEKVKKFLLAEESPPQDAKGKEMS